MPDHTLLVGIPLEMHCLEAVGLVVCLLTLCCNTDYSVII